MSSWKTALKGFNGRCFNKHKNLLFTICLSYLWLKKVLQRQSNHLLNPSTPSLQHGQAGHSTHFQVGCDNPKVEGQEFF
jgi:hypothetical protein